MNVSIRKLASLIGGMLDTQIALMFQFVSWLR